MVNLWLEGTTVSINGGKPFPAGDIRKMTEAVRDTMQGGRDRSAGRDE